MTDMRWWQATFDAEWLRGRFSELKFQNAELKESAETVLVSAEQMSEGAEGDQGGMGEVYRRLKKVSLVFPSAATHRAAP